MDLRLDPTVQPLTQQAFLDAARDAGQASDDGALLAIIGVAALLGALVNLWRGGQFFSAPKWLKLTACALPYGLVVAYAAGWTLDIGRMASMWRGQDWVLSLQIGSVLVALAGAFAATAAGHGAYFDLGHTQPEPTHDRIGAYQEERWLAWLRWIFPAGTLCGSRAAYEFLALALSGHAITLPAGIALALVGAGPAGLAVALSGLLKAPAYLLGWTIAGSNRAIQIGEAATGALLYGTLAAVAVSL